jgi:hypothetical protein
MSNTRLFGVTGGVDIGVLAHGEHSGAIRFGFTHLDQKLVFECPMRMWWGGRKVKEEVNKSGIGCLKSQLKDV